MFQKTGHGRINFVQFKTFIANLKAWQGVFKIYSKEKAGILRAERLRDALYDVGFQLSSDIMSMLMLKYMRKDGTLRLGDFTSAILHLTTAFGKLLFFIVFSLFEIDFQMAIDRYQFILTFSITQRFSSAKMWIRII